VLVFRHTFALKAVNRSHACRPEASKRVVQDLNSRGIILPFGNVNNATTLKAADQGHAKAKERILDLELRRNSMLYAKMHRARF
jgi:hypothetical protein